MQEREYVNLHLEQGRWRASCPGCGYGLASAEEQELCEQRAAGRRCPVCEPEPPAARVWRPAWELTDAYSRQARRERRAAS